jgi:hypothetical protein
MREFDLAKACRSVRLIGGGHGILRSRAAPLGARRRVATAMLMAKMPQVSNTASAAAIE